MGAVAEATGVQATKAIMASLSPTVAKAKVAALAPQEAATRRRRAPAHGALSAGASEAAGFFGTSATLTPRGSAYLQPPVPLIKDAGAVYRANGHASRRGTAKAGRRSGKAAEGTSVVLAAGFPAPAGANDRPRTPLDAIAQPPELQYVPVETGRA